MSHCTCICVKCASVLIWHSFSSFTVLEHSVLALNACLVLCNPLPHPSLQSQYGRIQYSLYGLVEHAGGMHGGHYVAYINAKRPESGHPSQQKDSTGTSCGVSDHPAPPQRTGDWYYMSDTHVRPASEGEVLKAQAYLLFYERIL